MFELLEARTPYVYSFELDFCVATLTAQRPTQSDKTSLSCFLLALSGEGMTSYPPYETHLQPVQGSAPHTLANVSIGGPRSAGRKGLLTNNDLNEEEGDINANEDLDSGLFGEPHLVGRRNAQIHAVRRLYMLSSVVHGKPHDFDS